MAKIQSIKNVTPPSAEEMESMSNAAIARRFARVFPTVEMTHFYAHRKGQPYVVSSNYLDITGSATEMLRLRILQEHMIPPGKKRKLSGKFSSKPGGSRWFVERLKADRLAAHFEIMGDDADSDYKERGYRDDLPADHPLQMCHPRHWPFGDAGQLRCYFERTRADARSWIADNLTTLRRNLGSMSQYGYSVHASDRAWMQQMVREFGEELLRAFDSARVLCEKAPQLRVVANTVRH
jgi:hypothetical protein